MFHRLRSLRIQLLLWTILPLTALLVALTALGIVRHRQAMMELIADRNRGLTLAEAGRLSRQIAGRAETLARAGEGLDSEPRAVEQLAADLQAVFPGGLALLAADGRVLAAAGATAWAETAESSRLASSAQADGRVRFADIWVNGVASLLIAAPAGASQSLVGAIPVGTLPISESSSLLEMAAPGAVAVLSVDGRLIHYHNPRQFPLDPRHLAMMMTPAHAHGAGTMPMSGDEAGMLVAYAPIDPPGWMLISIEDVHASASVGLSAVEVLPLIFLFVVIVTLLALYFGLVNVVRPLQELDRRAARVAWGEYEAVAEPVGGVQEIDDLRATLAQMSGRIRSYQAGMHDYLSAVTRAQEEERARLARELHDDTVQALIALKQRAQMAQKALGRDPGRAGQRLDELNDLIDRELASLRRLIGDLRPIYLEELGFAPALEMLAQQMERQHGLAVQVIVKGEQRRLPSDQELAAFRIVQQALSNVAAHAQAASVVLTIAFASDGLTLTIQDDGQGFTPPEQPSDLARQGHFGLMGMHERAMLYGGRLTINSAPGQGTTITTWLPRSDSENAGDL